MTVTNSARQGGMPGAPPSLLGWYSRPALHLVGAPVPPARQSPSRWQPGPPPLQYGIDYSFAYHDRSQPVGWRRGCLITVRMAGGPAAASTAVATVISELRVLTGLNLAMGEPWPDNLDPGTVPGQEIHVGYRPGRVIEALSAGQQDAAGLGGSRPSPDYACLLSGFAAVNTDVISGAATAPEALTVLRHEMAHALGLGHARRASLLMSSRLAASTTTFRRGDRHGLALLGRMSAGSHSPRRVLRAAVRQGP